MSCIQLLHGHHAHWYAYVSPLPTCLQTVYQVLSTITKTLKTFFTNIDVHTTTPPLPLHPTDQLIHCMIDAASTNIFSLIAFERYRKVFTPLNSVQPGTLYNLYALTWAAGGAAVWLAWAIGGKVAVQPSKLYCNFDFTSVGNFSIFIVFITVPLGGCVWAYAKMYYHLKSLGDDRVGDNAATRIEARIAMKVRAASHPLGSTSYIKIIGSTSST